MFRFFVDGRFHKKYDGWIGYENGEKGSVQAMLNGFAYMMDNFDLTMGIRPGYLLELHKICMTGVQTQNPKSSPGDLRFLNAGMPFFAKTTTHENLREILEMRRGDNTAVFNNKAYAKTAEQLNADELRHTLLQGTILNYRNWYPNLDEATRTALTQKDDVEKFYQAKHKVQIQFARRVNNIIAEFNHKMVEISDQKSRLWAIAQLIRDLELLHPFSDGNCRTFACVLLTQLLLNYEFTPAILENPNLDGECSLAQWVDEIKKGMQVTQTLLKDPGARVFGYSIRDAQPEHIQQFAVMSKDLVLKIQSCVEIYLTPVRMRHYTQGKWLSNCPDFLRFSGVGTENTYARGNVYFAFNLESLKKEGKDVRQFLTKVTAKGIKALVLDNPEYADGWDMPVLLVENAFAAFKTVAAQVRRDLNPFTILVTGTEGKTGAKVQLHHVMNFQVRAHGVLNSANTEVPVLRSLANLNAEDTFEINEVSVGSDEASRVERAKLVAPDLCLFTNIGPNHMDLHKTMDNVLQAKSSVVEGLRQDDGPCIVNSANIYYHGLVDAIRQRKPDARIITYGESASDSGQLLESSFDDRKQGWIVRARIEGESVNYFVPMPQHHAPLDSVGVLLTIKHAGLDVHQAAKDYATVQPFETMGRLLKLRKDDGEVLFYDQSRRGGISGMRSAFADIARFKIPGKIVALVGGISVLRDSDWTKEAHQQLAELINKSPIDRLYTTGNYIEYVHKHLYKPLVKHSNDLDELANLLVSDIEPGDLLLIIGSAYLYLGRVSDRAIRLLERGASQPVVYIGNSHPKARTYRLLRVYEDVSKGVGSIKACASNGVVHADYQTSLKTIPDYASYRGNLLAGFFRNLTDLLQSLLPMHCVTSHIDGTKFRSYTLNDESCTFWFNNLDKIANVPKRQVFGSFYDFGHPDYLLHVAVGTFNLHIGLVICPKIDGHYAPSSMDANAARKAMDNFQWPKTMTPLYRTWGPRWISSDLGRFIEPSYPRVFLAMADTANSPLFANNIKPFVLTLH